MLKNLKKVISTIAAVAILATSASAFAVTFPDVDESASYAGSVEILTALGVVEGDENGKFNPDNAVTRAEFAKMTVEALGLGDAAAKSTYTRFADAQGHWAAGFIETGVAKEFINGYDENTFGPNDTVTFAQAVKMLVGAAGYESWAQQAGGWTAGYMSYGSSLGITAGVTGVTNDTELTRAQCAILIANAMKAPLLVTDGYEFVGTMNGVVQVPNYVPMDGETHKGTWKMWGTMLTEYHNAFDVMGRVTGTSKNTTADKDEVMFQVEESKNIDKSVVEEGTWEVDGKIVNYPARAVKFGTTNAEDMLFEYASAIISVDEDSDEYTLLHIEKYAGTKTLEFAAEDVVTITGTQGVDADGVWSVTNGAVNVRKSEMTGDTKAYKLAADAEIYVNGFKLDPDHAVAGTADLYQDANQIGDPAYTDPSQIKDYIADNNKAGTVTLIDQTDAGTTVTDNVYDAVMITWTVSGRVEDVRTTTADNRIMLNNIARVAYDYDDEDVTVTFVKDGAEIAFEDIKEDDVITIVTNPYDNLNNLQDAVITVTNETVTGTVTKFNTTAQEVVVDGTEYTAIAAGMPSGDPLGKDFTFYLDANGVIVAFDALATNINYGIVTKYAAVDTNEYEMTLITAEGETVTYPVRTHSEWSARFGTPAIGNSWKLADAALSVDARAARVPNATVAYRISSGEIVADSAYAVVGNGVTINDKEYKESSSKIDSVYVDDTTSKIVDISAYIADPKRDNAEVMTVDMFQDEFTYDIVAFDRNSDTKAYQFVVVTDGVGSLRPESDLAIVKEYTGRVKIEEENMNNYSVLVNGEEVELNVSNQAANATYAEGTIIMYPVTSRDYVDANKITTVMAPATDYPTMLQTAYTTDGKIFDNFAAGSAALTVDGTSYDPMDTTKLTTKDSLIVNGRYDEDVVMHVGIAHEADMTKISLINDVASNASNPDQTEIVNIDGANMYTYSYHRLANEGYRVEVGGTTVTKGLFKPITTEITSGATVTESINWANAVGAQVFAPIVVIREVDGDATDVFYFIND